MTTSYIMSSKVERVTVAEGISPTELEVMLDKAAITSQMGFNRRYHHWLFRVANDNLLEDMAMESMVVVGKGDVSMHEECEDCGGDGCKNCNWFGAIRRLIRD